MTTYVGFIEEPAGVLLIAAGAESSDWAQNLRAAPACRVTIDDRTTDYDATEADDATRARAVVGLILKYGTPAERLGHGPVFRLVPR